MGSRISTTIGIGGHMYPTGSQQLVGTQAFLSIFSYSGSPTFSVNISLWRVFKKKNIIRQVGCKIG